MGYTETKVLIGGIAHIPVLISLFALVDRRYGKKYFLQKQSEKKAIAEEKARADAEAKAAKAAAEKSNEVMEIQSSERVTNKEPSNELKEISNPEISKSITNDDKEK